MRSIDSLAAYAGRVVFAPARASAWDFDASARRMAVRVDRSISSSVRSNRGRPLLCMRLRRSVARIISLSRSWATSPGYSRGPSIPSRESILGSRAFAAEPVANGNYGSELMAMTEEDLIEEAGRRLTAAAPGADIILFGSGLTERLARTATSTCS